jgi:hypothetical protein
MGHEVHDAASEAKQDPQRTEQGLHVRVVASLYLVKPHGLLHSVSSKNRLLWQERQSEEPVPVQVAQDA